MSNDEYKLSLANNNHYYFGYPSIYNSSSDYKTVFTALQSHKNTTAAATINIKVTTDDVNGRNNQSKDHLVPCQQTRPMNLITNNTGLDLSHSIRKQFSSYCSSSDSLPPNHNNNSYASSPSSSTSPSIDVENDDDSCDRIMSPVSIPSHQQKSILTDTRSSSQNTLTTMELTAGSIPSGFPLNYQQIYANNAALYGAPVMFSGAIHAAHASYMAGLPLHSALSPNESYLKAIQAAACGIYSPTALTLPPPTTVNHNLISHKTSNLHNPSATMMALAPSSVALSMPKSPQQYSPVFVNSRITDVEQPPPQQQQQQKKDYLAPPPPPPATTAATTTRLSASTISSGTYLNDKVNERLPCVDPTKDSHFKVPNGKEGSLKHRILRPPSNSDAISVEVGKTPTMRSYSSTSNFKKGNYIELANGALRRVEDMRTEDFIQCAERSPHHQLAESTVVKINTGMPSTAVITFSYDRNRSKVDMEVSLDHPFFVYGQGWASCNPEMSMKMFGLKCQRLQVGDICISLTKRDTQGSTPQTTTQTNNNAMTPQINEAINYQRRHSLTVSSPNSNLKTPSLSTMNNTPEMSYTPINANAYSIPVPQPNSHHHHHHLQQQQHIQQQQQLQHHINQQQQQHLQQQQQQAHQQAYAEMAKLMSSYAYAKGLPHEQLKDVILDAGFLQNLTPKMMSAFYQNPIFQFPQQQDHLRQNDLKNSQQRLAQSSSSTAAYNVTSHNNNNNHQSPQPTDLENNQNQPPQTQPLDASMSRKRRWSAPENMFDDDEADTQPPRNGSSPATASRS